MMHRVERPYSFLVGRMGLQCYSAVLVQSTVQVVHCGTKVPSAAAASKPAAHRGLFLRVPQSIGLALLETMNPPPPPSPRKSRDPTWTLSCKMQCCVVHHVAKHSRHLYATHVCAVAAKGGWIWEHKFEVDSGAYFFNLVSAH
jgi:hypothetical protein